jgi:hypothetical protein
MKHLMKNTKIPLPQAHVDQFAKDSNTFKSSNQTKRKCIARFNISKIKIVKPTKVLPSI